MDLFSYTAQAKFSQQHLLCLQDYTPDEIMQLLFGIILAQCLGNRFVIGINMRRNNRFVAQLVRRCIHHALGNIRISLQISFHFFGIYILSVGKYY